MHGDGDGWVQCAGGHRHWGRFGAAGLLLRAPDSSGGVLVLLQHRAPWTHQGGTWGIPGGARDSHETAWQAALREAGEEAGVPAGLVRQNVTEVVEHGGWSYATSLADAAHPLPTVVQRESTELRWVPETEVEHLPLHPGFAASWPSLRAPAVDVLVDAANVVGSRPDGWWRDRVGATAGLLAAMESLSPARRPARVLRLPGGGLVRVASLRVVVEGKAAAVPSPPADHGIELVRAAGSGDDAVAEHAQRAGSAAPRRDPAAPGRDPAAPGHDPAGPGYDAPRPLVVVTADRGLRARLPRHTVAAGPTWLLGLLD